MSQAAGVDAADRCPRCGGGFACGAASGAACACTSVQLSPALQQQLRDQFSGCLCLACLVALAAAESKAVRA
jgi:hypothetical protein